MRCSANALHQGHEGLGLGRVEAGRRLVEQQQFRRGGERDRHAEQPLLAMGEAARALAAARRQADEIEQGARLVTEAGFLARQPLQAQQRAPQLGPAAQMQRGQHVLVRGAAAEHAGALEGTDDAERRDALGRQPGQCPPAITHGADLGPQIAGDDVERGGLAGAVGADQAQDRALRHGERDLGQGDQAAEPHRDGVDLERRRAPAGAHGTALPRRSHPASAGTMPRGRKNTIAIIATP